MDMYADALELLARVLRNAILWSVAAMVVAALVVAVAGSRWLPLAAALASLAPFVAAAVTIRAHATVVREQRRRAAYNAQH